MQPLKRGELYPHQREWLDSDAFWSAMIGPYGCGKTGAAILYAWERSRINWGRRGLWVEPTYGMIQDIVLPELEEFLDAMEMTEVASTRAPLKADGYRLVRSQRPQLELPWGVWMFRSGEIPRRLKGPTVAWALLDEADQMDVLVEEIVLSRVRDPLAKFHCFGHVGTPEVYGSWLHERCEGDQRQDGDKVVRARQENVKGLPPEYYTRMKSSYDEAAYEQYGLGLWRLRTDGLIYTPPFSEANIEACGYIESRPVLVGMDFNVSPFSFVLAHQDGRVLRVFRQYRMRGANSQVVADTLKRDYPGATFELWIDPSGENRHTQGVSGSDADILRAAGFDVHWTRIGRVANRYNATRAMCRNAAGEVRLFIDPSCEQLIKELRTLTYEESVKQGADNHTTSALDYLVLGKFDPVRRG